MKVYIECFYADTTPILGTGDGQAVIHAKDYKRTNAYKRIRNVVGNGRVASAKIVTESGKILETIPRV